MRVRQVAPGDFDQWLPLWNGYNAFYGRQGRTALPRTITDLLWERFFDINEPVHGIVAEDDGRLLGIAHYLFHRNTIEPAMSCYMQDLFTVAEARGRGVGRALIDGVYLAADEAGSTRVYWHTQNTNEAGRRLYDKMAQHSGFIVYARPT